MASPMTLLPNAKSNETRLYKPRRFNKVSKQRFYRNRHGELTAHCGGRPTRAQLILIDRCISNEWLLLRLDDRQELDGELSEHSMRAKYAMENRLRLDLRELGLRPAEEPTMTLDDYLAAKAENSPDDGEDEAAA